MLQQVYSEKPFKIWWPLKFANHNKNDKDADSNTETFLLHSKKCI